MRYFKENLVPKEKNDLHKNDMGKIPNIKWALSTIRAAIHTFTLVIH